jgi:succinate dehydrogenase/fumarate reductase flavoprotein subunit
MQGERSLNRQGQGDRAQASWDVIVVGAGAAGLTAACKAAIDGASVLLLEQADVIGGTTAISGGMVWIPANAKMAAIGRPDTLDNARTYLEAVLPPGDRQRLNAFLSWGDEAVRDLETRTTTFRLQPVTTYPDYYPDLPGATSGGRVLEPEPFDAATLGANFRMLREPLAEFMLFGGMMISRQDIPHLRKFSRSLRSALHVTKLLLRYGRQRLGAPRGTTLYLGNALVGRLLKSALDLGVTIRTAQTVNRLMTDAGGRVIGAEVCDADQARSRQYARRGVILATGGVSHDGETRQHFVPAAAGHLTATVSSGSAPPGATLATDVGAALSPPTGDGAFWVPASTFDRPDGSNGVYPHTVTDRAKPGLVAVGADGRRFVNEAVSYHEFVRAQLANADRAIPAWLICDRKFLWKYGLGKVKPFSLSTRADIASGYLKRGNTIMALAEAIKIAPDSLQTTIEAYNEHASRGEDPVFGKGSNIYQRHLGDAENQPNPCVAPILIAPFYAVAVRPADLGMSAGIVTDPQAHVVRSDGSAIDGLYACGNDMASVMEGAYPGPGITLGPAVTFGWLAGRNARS